MSQGGSANGHPPAPVDPVSHKQWCAVDDYFNSKLLGQDSVLDQALQRSRDGGLADHAVAPNQGKLLYMFAKMMGARTILEVGTLGGYSTIWLARALPPDGKVITLEHNPTNAQVARENIKAAGFADKVDIIEGQAIDILAQLAKDKQGPFDLIFVDANKEPEREYIDGCIKLSRSGTLIIGDNVVRDGEVANMQTTDERVKGIHRATEMLQKDSRCESCALQTVGVKGWDGWLMVLVK